MLLFLAEAAEETPFSFDPTSLNMVWAILLLLVLGVAFAALLVLFSKIFHVEEDPRVEKVTELLPGYNCGACGKAGCHDLAEALVSGEVKNVTACKTGKKDKNYDPIIEYLKSTPGPDGTTVDVKL